MTVKTLTKTLRMSVYKVKLTDSHCVARRFLKISVAREFLQTFYKLKQENSS